MFSYPSILTYVLGTQKNHLTYVLGAQKNRLIEMVLLSTHNICFGWEIRKSHFHYALLTIGLYITFKWYMYQASNLLKKTQNILWLFLGINQYWAGWVYGVVVLCPGVPEGSTGSGSDELKGPWLYSLIRQTMRAGDGTKRLVVYPLPHTQ